MNSESRRAMTQDVERLIIEFFYHLDESRFEELAGLIADDGVWNRQGEALRGPAMVLAALRKRLAGTVTRHVVTNFLIDFPDENQAEASFYMTVFRHDADRRAEGPAAMELPYAVARCRARLVRAPAGWRIKELAATPTFRR
jgi:hypothetical protein